ncbi:MAG: glycosyltransferase family 39 protein [Hyphomicrobiales bacterium]|nr:glycosyltransferase family 39 protein [Hyphomicrobiales bacterium]
MIDRLAGRDGAVYLLLAAYFMINVVLRLASPASLELDEGQQLFFAQWLAPGYDSQPPFYNWLQYGVVQLLGSSVLAISALKNLMLFLSYLMFGLTAHLVIRDRTLAVIATLALITIPQVGYEAQRDLTHTVAVLFSACMFALFFFRALQQPTVTNYALVGVAIGFGILSKYNFALLPTAAALALLTDRSLRARLVDPRVLVTVAIATLIVLPHAVWFFGHVDEATDRTVLKLTADAGTGRFDQISAGFFSLTGALAAFAGPTLLVFAIAYRGALTRAWASQTDWTRLIGRMFLAALVLLLLIVLAGASNIKDRWLVPLFFLLPIYLCAKIEAAGETSPAAGRRFAGVVLAVMAIVPLVLFTRPQILGATGQYGKQNVPYGPATAEILASGSNRPSIILAIDHQLAGNLRLHGPGIPVTVAGYEAFEQPFVFDAGHPILAVWRRRDGAPSINPSEGMWTWLNDRGGLADRALDVRDAALPYHYGRDGDLYHFSYAWIYPAAAP